ncbi:MAG: hydroxyacid dehydrogenase [Alcaligenaceae bacterium]|nr:MAG: hydroxyacid dehydrogenase [Alcaligenaceae bacterium]
MRLAILDDYLGIGQTIVDWSVVPGLAVVSFRDHVHDQNELIDRLAEFDVVMRIRERTEFAREVLSRLPKLKLILATGMRNARSIDLHAADELGIVVSTTEAQHQTTVEVTWALILGLFRAIPQESASLRAGGWQVSLGRGLAGKTLGVVGLGNMGIPVAQIGQLFGMKVVAWSRNMTPARAGAFNVQAVSKEALFRQADVITIHMPLSDATLGLVSAADLALMKKDAFLINTSRPQIVEPGALLEALEQRRIGGAGLDVFEVEPLPFDHPYRSLPNVLATPHIGFVTKENMEEFFHTSLKNLLAFLTGSPLNVINGARPFLPDSQVSKQMHAKGV